ncbi:MAG: phosphoribosylanthranilate isomerase [Dehalococcoidia bacterium]
MVRVKICGITNLEDALAAIEAGADALGFVFAPSPRQLTLSEAARIIDRLPPLIFKVGVFVDENLAEVQRIMAACPLHLAQLHGSEGPEYCQHIFAHRTIKSFQVRDDSVLEVMPHYQVSAYLLDAYHPGLKGGSGHTFNWEIARRATELGPIILSGGLTPENVAGAVSQVRPYGVDVSSGVESEPGKKDHARLREFVRRAKGVETG